MLLAIDIGNTSTAFGVFNKTKLILHWKIPTSKGRPEIETWSFIKRLFNHKKLSLSSISDAVISSVVPKQTLAIQRTIRKRLKLNPLIVSAKLDLGIKIHYNDPSQLGADRLCNAVAAFEKYGGPTNVIDLGTATTYVVISKRGDFLGGVIAPGIETVASSLHQRTALLPKVNLLFPKKVIAKNTTSSIQAGILFGAVDAMEGTIKRIKKEIEPNAKVIATGGWSKLIAKHTKMIDYVEPTLVLDGARMIYEKIKIGEKNKNF
jgi:type III pantothenate kinase